MAKKEVKTELVKVDENDDVMVPEEFKQFVGQGAEDLGAEDMKMPRLALAQGLSDQLNPESPLYIEGLRLGDAFNTVTGEVYGRGPWEVAVIKRFPPRWIEFVPRNEGGGVKDLNVPRTDPRCLWRNEEKDGRTLRLPPVATQFYDYVIVFLETREVIAASFKGTGISLTAKPWNSLIKMRASLKPMFMGKYTLRAVMAKNAKGTFAALQVANAGWVKPEGDILNFLAESFLAFREKEVQIDREPGSDDGDEPSADM